MKNILAIIAISASFTACKPEGRIYDNHKELSPKVEWLKKDIRQFEVVIDDIDKTYKMSLSFRYSTGYQYQFAKVKVTEISPSRKEVQKNYDLKVREDNGDYIGEAGYDIWDSEHLVEAAKTFIKKGTYTFVIEHNMPNDPLNFAMEIGLILDEVQ